MKIKGWAMVSWHENSWEELRWQMRRDEKWWGGVKRFQMRWNEMKCGVRSVECDLWPTNTVWHCSIAFYCVAAWPCAGRVLGQQQCTTFAQIMHARAWVVHSACKFYMWKRSCGFLDNNGAPLSTKQACTHGAGWRTAHASSIDEKGLIVKP
jgi:hypothetical protein